MINTGVIRPVLFTYARNKAEIFPSRLRRWKDYGCCLTYVSGDLLRRTLLRHICQCAKLQCELVLSYYGYPYCLSIDFPYFAYHYHPNLRKVRDFLRIQRGLYIDY